MHWKDGALTVAWRLIAGESLLNIFVDDAVGLSLLFFTQLLPRDVRSASAVLLS